MTKSLNLINKWKLDLSPPKVGGPSNLEGTNPPGFSRSAALPGAASLPDPAASSGDTGHLLTKRAWDIALAPIKQLPMNLFMMYMAGSSISIFPIMMVGMMAMRPLKAMMGVKAQFGSLEAEMGGSLLAQKAVFVLGNLGAIGIAVYKCHSMGLLPTHASDWLDFQTPPQRMEYASAGLAYV